MLKEVFGYYGTKISFITDRKPNNYNP